MSEPITLISPLDGKVVALENVPDPVFSERMLGNGMAIWPTSQTVFSPFSGTVININSASHALVIKHGDIELLIHVGLESVALKGEGFTLFVKKGERVTAGQKLLSFDLNILTKKAASPLVLLVVTSPADSAITPLAQDAIKTGLPFFSIDGSMSKTATMASLEVVESAPIPVLNANGLHARPAAILSAIAATHPYLVEIRKGNQCADAKSIVSLMGLGLTYKDIVTIRVFGPKGQAQEILDRLATAFKQGINRPVAPTKTSPKTSEVQLQGTCACGGLARGKAFLLNTHAFSFEENASNSLQERQALDQALQTLKKQMEEHLSTEQNAVTRDILHAHLLLLNDPLLTEATHQLIEQGKTAAFAFNSAIRRSVDILKQTKNRFLMERIADLKDLRREVLCQLTGQQRRALNVPEESIIVAEELLPSDVASLPPHVTGVLLANGSPTSHAGILLRNRGIPSIFRAGPKVLDIPSQAVILLDADMGKVLVSPSEEQVQAFENRRRESQEITLQESARAQEPATTQDGLRVYVEGNIAGPNEAARAYAVGAEGVGLVRTEFLFQDRSIAPSENEQLAAYQSILDALPGKPVTFRLLDAGGDKPLPFVHINPEENPTIGVRGIRALEKNERFFRTQLRALLRLPEQNRVRIMLPMVSFVDEIKQFQEIFKQEASQLGLSQKAQLGIMVEVPSAALLAAQFAPYTDFFSIGTNDLTQYTLAIDRNHKELSPLADAMHPAVLRLISQTCEGAKMFRKPVSVCGALASEPDAVPFLIGLGVTHLAVSAGVVARTKARIRKSNFHRCAELAKEALQLSDANAVRELLKKTAD